MTKEFNIINECCLLLLRWIEYMRQGAIRKDFEKRINAVHSNYLHIKPNGLGGFDIKNLQFHELNELNRLCRYMREMNQDSALVELFFDQTNDAIAINERGHSL